MSKQLQSPLRRTLNPEVRIVDEKRGIVDYVASDESIDCYNELIRSAGWRFTLLSKNGPFVDSHDYYTIEKLVGKILDFKVDQGQLIERVQWAQDVEENRLARLGWRMTLGGYLKAVSVGFFPVRWVSAFRDPGIYATEIEKLGLDPAAAPRVIYLEQEQIELSTCIIGANPNALAKAFKAGAIAEEDIEFVGDAIERAHRADLIRQRAEIPAPPSQDHTPPHASRAPGDAAALDARQRRREDFLRKLHNLTK